MSTLEDFERDLAALPDCAGASRVAVGVSGGPDSMALLWLLSGWAQKHNVQVYAYTVDHGLRAESRAEAEQVGQWIGSWPAITHRILTWQGDKPETRILEQARAARYALLKSAMREDGATTLFIAHHRDDQAETFLIRLAKGSGLDGLAGMNPVQSSGDGITLVRPLLDVSKEDLILLCNANSIPYVDDPTNKNESYLRPRLRAAQAVLEEEGLSSKRLAQTAKRLARARSALETLSRDLHDAALISSDENGSVFDFNRLRIAPEELVVRVMLKAMDALRPGADYAPRLEKLENLVERVLHDDDFKGATLGGCIFAKHLRNASLSIRKE